MRISIDLDTFVVSDYTGSAVQALSARRGDSFPVEVRFTQSGVVRELPNAATGRLAIKSAQNYSAPMVAGNTTWRKVGYGVAAYYVFQLSLATEPIAAAFSTLSGDLAQVSFVMEVEWSHRGVRSTSRAVAFTVENDFIKGDEGDPDMVLSESGYVIAKPGDNLAAKYTAAKALTPNGEAKSATNRASLIIFPGTYTLSAELAIDAEFVDVLGLGAQTRTPAVLIAGNTANVTANNVRVSGLSVGGQQFNITGDKPLQVFENCTGGNSSFGFPGIASGTFTNCTGGNSSFGGFNGAASGTFTNCTGGTESFGGFGTASGTFTNCTGGTTSFGGENTASGTFTNCTGEAVSFGGFGIASGTFTDCTGGQSSFADEGTARGKFVNCRLTAGQYPSLTAPATGKAIMINCLDGNGNINNAQAPL